LYNKEEQSYKEKNMNKNALNPAQGEYCGFWGNSPLVASFLACLNFGKVGKVLRGLRLQDDRNPRHAVMLSDSETSHILRPQNERKPLSLTLSLGERTFGDISRNLTISNLRKFLIFLFPSKNKKAAFTLAEVLITLGIIGVVAAITLPTLIQNHQKKTYVEGLKTGISILSQGFRKMLADEGVDDLSNTEMEQNCNFVSYNTSSGKEVCEAILSKYFKVVKFQSQSDLTALGDTVDGTNTDTADCQNLVGKANKWWYLNNKTKCYGNTSSVTITLSNGMKVYLLLFSYSSYATGFIFLDINGGKGPNTYGRDAFLLYILPNGNVVGNYDGQYSKAYADYYGQSADTYRATQKDYAERNCSPTTNGSGEYCSGRIINDGWKMNY
jgi:prepilin-type N-terminal cleavage/methylation domain-containing protein